MSTPSIRIKQDGDDLIISFEKTRRSPVAKIDNDRQIVFGWANVCIKTSGEQVVDSDDEMIDPDELENAAYNFVLSANDGTGEEHLGVSKGQLIESMFFTPEKLVAMGLAKNALPIGWWVGFHVEDEKAWRRVKSGRHKMFSIQGVSRREEVS